MGSPTQRSLDLLRKEGFIACVVEKWVPASPEGYKGRIITRDAWNFADILACNPEQKYPGALLVQTTSGPHVHERIEKIRSIKESGIWLKAGNRIEVHGWRKLKGKWAVRRFVLTLQGNYTGLHPQDEAPDLGPSEGPSYDDAVNNALGAKAQGNLL